MVQQETGARDAAMTPQEFKDWMAVYEFDADMLSEALGVHRVSILKWRSGRHPINRITYLALQFLAADKHALKARQQAREVAEQARHTAVATAEAARATATRRTVLPRA